MLLWTLNLGGRSGVVAVVGGGGGAHHRMEQREEQRLYHPRPAFGFYADQLRRQQLRVENNAPKPKLRWERHYDED